MTPASAAGPAPLLDVLFEDPAAGRCLVDPAGRVVRANAEWLRSTGYALDEVLGAELLALFPETLGLSREIHARARAGERVEVPRHRQQVNGRETWWEGWVEPVALPEGQGLLLTAREVGATRRPVTPLPTGRRALAELLASVREAADRVPAAVFLKDAAGRYLFASRWMLRLLGLRRGQLLGRTAAEVLPAPVAARLAEHDRRVAEGTEVESEDTIPAPGGDRILLVVRFSFPLGHGPPGIVGVGVDVTERRRAEAALRESEERFRRLADVMPQIVCVLGPDGVPEYVNHGWIVYSGLDLAATRRTGWESFLSPDDLDTARAMRRRALKERTPQVGELRYRRADGVFRWFLSRLVPVVEGGRVVRLVGAALDIEERRCAEQALREQLATKDQLAKVAASVPGVVCSFRLAADGSVSMPFSAPAAEELYGFPREALARDMGVVFARVPPEDLPAMQESVATSARTLSPWRATFRYQHPQKGLRWLAGTSIPTREEDGSVLWHGYVADVTEQRLAEEALLEADRRRSEFLSVLSHELRNPLAPIRTSLYVLERAAPDSPQAHRAREVASRQVTHLARLVDDLLDVTRITRGKLQLRRSVHDLREVVRRACEDHAALFEGARVKLGCRIPDAPAWAEVDLERLAQVAGNLLQNAAKFTSAGGRVDVELAADGGRAELRVKDTGIGIAPDLLERVFRPFEQEQRGLSRTAGGLGLGLALARGLAERHGGTLRAYSAGPGKGAEFVLTLPLAPAPGERPAEAGRRRGAAPPRRILLVEDDLDVAASLADLLGLEGHQVEVARDGRSGIALARDLHPDLVLCDLGLPEMDGFAVARALRSDPGLAGIRLVAVSGHAQPEDRERALSAGFDAHLPKPTPLEELEDILAGP